MCAPVLEASRPIVVARGGCSATNNVDEVTGCTKEENAKQNLFGVRYFHIEKSWKRVCFVVFEEDRE